MFTSQMALLGFFSDSSFLLPHDKYSRLSIVRERESAHGGGTREDRSTINFDHVQVQTPASALSIALCPSGKGLRTLKSRLSLLLAIINFKGLLHLTVSRDQIISLTKG